MKRIILAILAIFSTLAISAQSLRLVEGIVQDKQGVGIPNAKLVICGTDKSFYTNSDGKFSINIPTEAFAIIAIADGYRSKKMEIDGSDMLFSLKQLAPEEYAATKAKAERELEVESRAEANRNTAEDIPATIKKYITKDSKKDNLHDAISHNLRTLKYLGVDSSDKSYTELGNDYFYGRNGKSVNQAKAFLHYNLGAANGENEAYLLIAFFYETGREFEYFTVEKDLETALIFCNKAVELNVPGAKEQMERLSKKFQY
jgi:hypothetical protein